MTQTLNESLVKCQQAIRAAAERAVADLKAETSLTPSSIEIHMIDVSTHDNAEHIVGHVRIGLSV